MRAEELVQAIEGMTYEHRHDFRLFLEGWLLSSISGGDEHVLREVAGALQGFLELPLRSAGPARPPAAEDPAPRAF